MIKIRMNKEMPLSIEWMPQNAYMHNSLDHMLSGNQNQSNFVLVKQEMEFFENVLNPQPICSQQNMCLSVSSKEDREIKEPTSNSNIPICQTGSLNESPLKTKSSEKLCNRGRIDVIEMSVETTSDYKYFFIYEDQQSKFVVLKALCSNTAKEVATELLNVLAIIGAPRVLQSGNGRKFAEQIVQELRLLWKDFLILHGDMSTYEASRRDFKSLLESWVRKNPTKTWHEGLNFVQIFHNTTYRCQNGKIPCDILFGRNVHESFQNLNMKNDIKNLWTEEEWIAYLSNREDSANTTAIENTQSTSNNANHYNGNKNAQNVQSQNVSSMDNDYDFIAVKDESFVNSIQIDLACVNNKNVDTKDESKENAQSLTCKYCQKRYMKLGHLRNHIKTHRGGEVLKCELCGKTFGISRLYEKHLKQSHGRDKLSGKEDRAVRRSTRNNTSVITTICNGEREKIRTSNESESDLRNKNCEKSIVRVKCDKIVKNSSPIGRRKLSANGRVSRIQCALQCTYCKQKFSFPSVLERHMRSHTNERPYVCEVCNKSFKQLGHLSQHSLTHHDYRSFQCMACGVKFDSLDNLKQHVHSHRGDATTPKIRDVYRLFECDSCKKVFTTKSVLERHIFTHTQERQYDCKVCGKRFKQAGHVKSHMLVHTGERRFQCTVCSKRFSLSNSLKKHMYVHNGEKPYQCDVCGARFLEKRNLNGHLLTHTNERPYCCKICGKRYTLADTLRRHVSAAHEDGRTYQCEICAKMFKQLAHLSVHKKVHNDERPFQCHLCEKNFKHKNVLKSHLAIHANVRPFECDVCKATFVRKTNLQTHISSAHMNERPYVCKICGKRFKQISHLNGHVVVHSNLMPYKCDYCDRRCNRLDNLKKHMRLHMKNKE